MRIRRLSVYHMSTNRPIKDTAYELPNACIIRHLTLSLTRSFKNQKKSKWDSLSQIRVRLGRILGPNLLVPFSLKSNHVTINHGDNQDSQHQYFHSTRIFGAGYLAYAANRSRLRKVLTNLHEFAAPSD